MEGPFAENSLGLDARLVKAVEKLGYQQPTPTQAQSLPKILEGKDVIIQARTGSGKTLAYALAVLQRILQKGGAGGGASSSSSSRHQPVLRALVLLPTRELVDQTLAVFNGLAHYCRDVVTFAAIGGAASGSAAAGASAIVGGGRGGAGGKKAGPATAVLADVLIGTAGKVRQTLVGSGSSAPALGNLELLILDEADLLTSYGYEEDVKAIAGAISRAKPQAVLLSATLPSQLEELKRIALNNPQLIKVDDGSSSSSSSGGAATANGHLTQFYIRIGSADRFLLLFALIKLRLIAGKALFFVNSIEAAYKLRLFLERFSIASVVLNAELPANSRAHILAAFNSGTVDYLIATDASLNVADAAAAAAAANKGNGKKGGKFVMAPPSSSSAGDEDEEDEEEDGSSESSSDEDSDASSPAVGSKRKRPAPSDDDDEEEEESDDSDDDKDEEDDVSESNESSEEEEAAPAKQKKKKESAKARKQRQREEQAAAEATQYGVARGVDFRGVTTVINFDAPTTAASYTHRVGRTARGGASGVSLTFIAPEGADAAQDKLLESLQATQPADGATGAPQPSPLPFDVGEVEGFRYRVEDVLRSVTDARVREARAAELRHEIAASSALAAHFEDNPQDLQALLKHDKRLDPGAVKPHLKDVPAYLLPASLRAAVEAAGGGVGKNKRKNNNAGNKRARTDGGPARGAAAMGGSSDAPDSLAEIAALPRGVKVPASHVVAVAEHEAYNARRSNIDPLKAFAYRDDPSKAAAAAAVAQQTASLVSGGRGGGGRRGGGGGRGRGGGGGRGGRR